MQDNTKTHIPEETGVVPNTEQLTGDGGKTRKGEL